MRTLKVVMGYQHPAPYHVVISSFSPIYTGPSGRIAGPKPHYCRVPVVPMGHAECHPCLKAHVIWDSGAESLKESLRLQITWPHAQTCPLHSPQSSVAATGH